MRTWVQSLGSALASLALTGAACSPSAHPAPTTTHAAVAVKPRVLVSIVVDQLAGWIAEERWPELPQTGGFSRLVHEGTWVKHVRYAHAATETAMGHASLYTAVTPNESGIFANEVPAEGGSRVSSLRDPRVHLVTEEGEDQATGSSLARLRVETLADRLVAAHPDAVVVSLSLKDRGALFAAGRKPRAALWFEPKRNRFVTSTAFAHALPSWAPPVAGRASLARLEAETWNPLDPAWVAGHARTADDAPGEGDELGFGVTFPHALAAVRDPGYGLRTSRIGVVGLFSLALAALDGESLAGHPVLLALSLSANDYVGHVFGPDSWEAWDELFRLDAALGRFLAALDQRFGRDGYAVLLTADHGVTTMPEAATTAGVRRWCAPDATDPWQRACGPVGRILPDGVLAELEDATRRALGPGDWIAAVVDPYVYITPAARALEPRRRSLLDAAITRALRGHPEVDQVFATRALPAACPAETDDTVAALVCRSVASGAGDYYVVPARGSFFDPDVVVGKGTSHGSPYRFDRVVPLVAYARGWIPGGAAVEDDVGYETFARTACDLLGIPQVGHGAWGAPLVRDRLR